MSNLYLPKMFSLYASFTPLLESKQSSLRDFLGNTSVLHFLMIGVTHTTSPLGHTNCDSGLEHLKRTERSTDFGSNTFYRVL